LTPEDFTPLTRLGHGDVGAVHLVSLRDAPSAKFAMKVLVKQEMVDRNKLHRVRTEGRILEAVDHPFVATLYSAFQTDTHLYFLMEYCEGGELYETLQKQPGKRFTEATTKFYAAEVLCALQYLHLMGFIYRDLKPENILLRRNGHVIVTDFDLSYCASSRAHVVMIDGKGEDVVAGGGSATTSGSGRGSGGGGEAAAAGRRSVGRRTPARRVRVQEVGGASAARAAAAARTPRPAATPRASSRSRSRSPTPSSARKSTSPRRC
jgi:non-specific serine/threonine protein kinase